MMVKNYNDEASLLLAQAGPLNGKQWLLGRNLLIGRETSCDIVITDRQVSRHHARISVSPKGIFLEDLKSKNGTHRNGKRLNDTVTLQDGDVVQIALVQRFVFLSSDATLPLNSQDLEPQISDQYQAQEPFQSTGRLRLDKKSRRVWINVIKYGQLASEEEVVPPLSVSQFRLLEQLYENQGRVISRYELISAVWGENQALEVSVQALDALVRRLRNRLANVDATHSYIVTVRGHGLRLDNPPIE
jgi:pSer/pThr/pTyr-binding forkhead associated (FHA) protein